MPISLDDRAAIIELLALHGHLFDDGELDRLDELFTASVSYDVTALGGGVLRGIEAIRDAALALGERNPVGHHVTNVVLAEQPDGSSEPARRASASTPTGPSARSRTTTRSSVPPEAGASARGPSCPDAHRSAAAERRESPPRSRERVWERGGLDCDANGPDDLSWYDCYRWSQVTRAADPIGSSGS